MTDSVSRKASILLVEDSEADIVLTKKAFAVTKLPHQIYVAQDGETALSMLAKEGEYINSPDFDLIILDINLPQINGQDVLIEIKKSKEFQYIPIIMLSSSREQIEAIKHHAIQANSYIIKGEGLESFKKVATAIETCWFN